MAHHRFRELVEAVAPNSSVAPWHAPAFVPCPVFAAMTAAQQSWVQYVYQLAAGQVQTQTPPHRPFRIPEFSRN